METAPKTSREGGGVQINLIHFLDFYLLTVFLLSTLRRIGQYRTYLGLAVSLPGRWPNLFRLVQQHKMVFLTWATVAPALLALGLSVVQLLASRVVWPEAGRPPFGLTVERLLHNPGAMAAVVPLGLAMVAMDGWGVIRLGRIDREALEKNFDQAEYWLKSRTATVVRVVTFGFLNPRKMVNDEVHGSLLAASRLVNHTLWWVSIQVGLRILFGLSLWLTWAFGAL